MPVYLNTCRPNCQSATVSQMPVGQMAVGQMPVGQMPVGQMPVGHIPVGKMVFDLNTWNRCKEARAGIKIFYAGN